MLNEKGQRELAYVVAIDAIEPIVGSDNCEAAVVGGWKIMVRKNTFKVGDLAVYFEIDSRVDATNSAFAFLEKKHYAVKTQRYTFGGTGNFVSQGLLMTLEDLGLDPLPVGTFLTEKLKITYYEAEDNTRKANSFDKYKIMAQRHGKLFSKPFFRWMMKRSWGKKILFIFFGKKRDVKKSWPAWVKKTDEERVQNIPWIVNDIKKVWVMSEKVDGSSTTFTIRKKLFGYDFFICSRNVVFDTPEKEARCYYDTNIYTEMAKEYDIKNKMIAMMKLHPEWKWATIQGETYGANIQRRNYSTDTHHFMAFNFITSEDGRWGSVEGANYLNQFGIPWVPLLNTITLPTTMDELIAMADGESMLDNKEREGLVFRSLDGKDSFKVVSNNYLLKYHS